MPIFLSPGRCVDAKGALHSPFPRGLFICLLTHPPLQFTLTISGEAFEGLSLSGYEDEGPVPWMNSTAEQWIQRPPSWNPFRYPMSYFFVDQTHYSSIVPLTVSFHFGGSLPVLNETFSEWSAGPLPSDTFYVSGLDKCPMSKFCRPVSPSGMTSTLPRLDDVMRVMREELQSRKTLLLD